jgi:hypothetical protein
MFYVERNEIKITELINWEISFLSDSQKNVFWFELIIMTKDAGIVCISYNYKIRFTGKKVHLKTFLFQQLLSSHKY